MSEHSLWRYCDVAKIDKKTIVNGSTDLFINIAMIVLLLAIGLDRLDSNNNADPKTLPRRLHLETVLDNIDTLDSRRIVFLHCGQYLA